MGGGGKGSGGQAPYERALTGAGSDYLLKRLNQPQSQINVPAMGALTNQVGAMTPSASFQTQQGIKVDPNQFKTLRDMGTEQIAQSSKMAQDTLLNQMAQRGLGQSGLAAKAVADQYSRGAGQDASNLARQLTSQQLGMEFEDAQKARDLNAQLAQTGAQLNLQRGLGLGQLGLGEQAQNLAQQQAQFGQNNYMVPIMAALAQTGITAAASRNSGKGGK